MTAKEPISSLVSVKQICSVCCAIICAFDFFFADFGSQDCYDIPRSFPSDKSCSFEFSENFNSYFVSDISTDCGCLKSCRILPYLLKVLSWILNNSAHIYSVNGMFGTFCILHSSIIYVEGEDTCNGGSNSGYL